MTSALSLFGVLGGTPAEPAGGFADGQEVQNPAAFAAALLAALATLQPAPVVVEAPVAVVPEDGGAAEAEGEGKAPDDAGTIDSPAAALPVEGEGQNDELVEVSGQAVELPETMYIDPGALMPVETPAGDGPIVLPADLRRRAPEAPVEAIPVTAKPVAAKPVRRERDDDRETPAAPPRQLNAAPAPSPAPAALIQAFAAPPASMLAPAPMPDSEAVAPRPEPPRVAPQPQPNPSAPPAEGLEEWSLAGNARLASQIAELMGGLNVTEFKVELGRRTAPITTGAPASDQPAPDGEKALLAPAPPRPDITADPAAPTVMKPQPAPQARPAAAPVRLAVAAPVPNPDQQPIVSTRQPGPAPRVTPAPAPAPVGAPAATGEGAATAPAARAIKGATLTIPAMPSRSDKQPVSQPAAISPRAERQPTETSLPVDRQELPAAEPAVRRPPSSEPSRVRPRREIPSESMTPSSAPAPERLTVRGDAAGSRGPSEARNLPHSPDDLARPAGTADRVTLQVSDGDGRATRIRVSVVGQQVRAVITPPDAESARQLEQRMDELQSALARQGFRAGSVTVQAAETRGGGDALAGAGQTLASNDARSTPGRDEPAGDQRQGRGQREQHSAGGQERQQQGRSRDQGAQQRRR